MRTIIATAILVLIFAVFCTPLGAQTTPPTFLFLLEGKGTPVGSIHVFSMNAATGGVTEVPGSPFNAGLLPNQLVIDPTGRYVYVTNDQSEDITEFLVNASTGSLTEIPGSPVSIGAQPVTSAVDPTGRFLYVFATSDINGLDYEFLYEYTIDDSTGILTAVNGTPVAWEFGQGVLISSIAFDPQGNFAYLGQSVDGNLGVAALVCSINFSDGILTEVGSFQIAGGEADHLTVAPNGNFLYSADVSLNKADAFAIGSEGGSLTEIVGSPYPVPNNPSSLVVHPSSDFLYVANANESYQTNYSANEYDGSISAFAINSETGALTQLANSPVAAGINPASVVVDPTGSYVFTTATKYTTGYTAFAQILGFSVNPSTGVLTPFSAPAWTDAAESMGNDLEVSAAPSTNSNPVPMISSFSPESAVASGPGFALLVSGTNFVSGARVYFGGQPRVTTFVSSTQLSAAILASDIDNGGTAIVFVFNPLPGGGSSTSIGFAVANPTPVITSLNPGSVNAGGAAISVAVAGSNFVTTSVVNFNGAAMATSYIGPTELQAEIPAVDIASQGTASITVTSPSFGGVGGGSSNTLTLTILAPLAPLDVSNVSPNTATVGGPAFSLTVNGTGFLQGSQVSFNLINVSTTFVNATQLVASIPASAITLVSNPYVIVTNPNGATSNPLTFPIVNPQPAAISVFPSGLPVGSTALSLNLSGTGFAPTSVVFVGGSARATVYVSSILLQATLLPVDLSQGGTLNITVMNPPPGGGSTAVVPFVVSNPMPQVSQLSPSNAQPGSGALTVNVSGSNFDRSSSVVMNGTVLPTTFVSSASLQVLIPASDLLQAGTLNVVVSSPAPGGGTTPALPFTIDDFTLTAPTSSVMVTAGQPAPFSLMVMPSNGTYSYPITFTATGLPMGTAPAYTPPSPVTFSASGPQLVSLSVTTTAHTETSSILLPHGPYRILPLLFFVTLALILVALSIRPSIGLGGRMAPRLLLAVLVLAATGLIACASVGAGASSSAEPNPATGTPAGTYPIIVTATSGTAVHSTTITLTVM